MPVHTPYPPPKLPFRQRIDGEPRRAVTCLNVRRDDKAVFDHVVSWWKLRFGQDLSQWDAFSRVLELALSNPAAELPTDLVEDIRQMLAAEEGGIEARRSRP